jgi:hypothetical protein
LKAKQIPAGANQFPLAEKRDLTSQRNHSWRVRNLCRELARSWFATLQGGASDHDGTVWEPKIVAARDGDICRERQFLLAGVAGSDARSCSLLVETATP